MRFQINDNAVIINCATPYEGAACTILEPPRWRGSSSGDRVWGYLVRLHGLQGVIIVKPTQLIYPKRASTMEPLASAAFMRDVVGWRPERRRQGREFIDRLMKGLPEGNVT